MASDKIRNEGMKILIEKMNRCAELSAKRGQAAIAFDFPQIVVIGSQSSGKSSVLEGIVGREFLPRGPDMVTRCPLVLQLHYKADVPETQEYAIFAEDQYEKEKRIENFALIAPEIDFRTSQRASHRKCISKAPIVLNIYSSTVVDLQLVDLPGFVMNPLPDQPADIQQQIEDLVDDFIRRENTLILAISQATDDIAASVAIQRAKLVDKDLSRTIGVITKMDVPTGQEKIDSLIEVLENRTIKIHRGYVGVINRSQEQVENRTPVREVRELESDFFKNKRGGAFTHLAKRMGINYLQNFLNKELAMVIEAKLPEFITAGERRLREIESALGRLDVGKDLKEQTADHVIVQKVGNFCEAVSVALEGNRKNVRLDDIDAGAEIKSRLKKSVKIACNSAMMVNNDEVKKSLKNALTNLDAAHDSVLVNPLSFRIMVGILVEQFQQPLLNLLEEITSLLITHLQRIANKTLSVHPKLSNRVLDVVRKKVDEYRNSCGLDIRRQVDVQKIFINVGHPDFKYYKNLISGQGAGDTAQNEQSDDEDSSNSHFETYGNLASIKAIRKNAQKIFSDLQAAAPEGAVAAPTDIDEGTLFFLELVYAYMIVVEKTLCDMAQRVIMFHMVNNVEGFIRNSTFPYQIVRNGAEPLNEDTLNELLETNSADQKLIDDMLADQESIQETIQILKESSAKDFIE